MTLVILVDRTIGYSVLNSSVESATSDGLYNYIVQKHM